MVRETSLSASDLMMLYFVVDTPDEDFRKEIPSMPGQYQLSLRQLEKTVGEAVDAGTAVAYAVRHSQKQG